MNFTTWYRNADIPTKDENGVWYDAETGIAFEEKKVKTVKVEKHPDSWMKIGQLKDKIERLINNQRYALNKYSNTLDCTLITELIEKYETTKLTKANILNLITENSEVSREINNQIKGA